MKCPHRERRGCLHGCPGRDLDLIFSLQFQRTVNRDNTVSFQHMSLQIDRVSWRGTLAGCSVTVHQHLNGSITLTYGSRCRGRYTAEGQPTTPITTKPQRRVEKTAAAPLWKSLRDSHFPTLPAAGD